MNKMELGLTGDPRTGGLLEASSPYDRPSRSAVDAGVANLTEG